MKLIFSILCLFAAIKPCTYKVLDSTENFANIDLNTFNGVIILRTKKECIGCNIPINSYLHDSLDLNYISLTLVNGTSAIYGENQSLIDILPSSKTNYFDVAEHSDRNYNQTPKRTSIFAKYDISTSPSILIASAGKVSIFKTNNIFSLDGSIKKDIKVKLVRLSN